LDPIVSVAVNFLGIAVNPTIPVQTLEEFIAYAKARRGKLSYGHSGIGSTNHLTGELFKSLTGNPEIVQVPYRGAAAAMTDLMSGQLPMAVVAITGQVVEFHRSGKMRVLAVTSPKRLIAAPELPTATEAGLAGLTVPASLGLLAPAGTPTPIIDQIAQATRTALADRDYQAMLLQSGFEPILDSTPEKFRQSLAADVALWTPVVKTLGLKID
jgi:tripartite-type tricarboxylate transporter receptor subunit TctC